MKVKGKTAVVTGASSGIGRGTAVALAKRGCHLALVARSREQLELTRKMTEAYQVKASIHVADLADREQINRLPEQILAEHGAVDLLFNIAGVVAAGTFMEIGEDTFEHVMNVNFMSTAYTMKRFLPYLITRPEAHIINCSSVQGVLSFAGDSAYSASKFAVRGLSNAIRFELEDDTHVHVSCVIMGGVASNLVSNAIPLDQLSEEERAKRRKAAQAFSDKVLGMDPMTAGEGIVIGTEKNQPRIVVGRDARFAILLERLFPVHYWPFLRRMIGR